MKFWDLLQLFSMVYPFVDRGNIKLKNCIATLCAHDGKGSSEHLMDETQGEGQKNEQERGPTGLRGRHIQRICHVLAGL